MSTQDLSMCTVDLPTCCCSLSTIHNLFCGDTPTPATTYPCIGMHCTSSGCSPPAPCACLPPMPSCSCLSCLCLLLHQVPCRPNHTGVAWSGLCHIMVQALQLIRGGEHEWNIFLCTFVTSTNCFPSSHNSINKLRAMLVSLFGCGGVLPAMPSATSLVPLPGYNTQHCVPHRSNYCGRLAHAQFSQKHKNTHAYLILFPNKQHIFQFMIGM